MAEIKAKVSKTLLCEATATTPALPEEALLFRFPTRESAICCWLWLLQFRHVIIDLNELYQNRDLHIVRSTKKVLGFPYLSYREVFNNY